uniref:Uncharacterized protein n=1 Tax=Trichuris muris TaxID=70415 RepID=A0A5S6QII7_TRIMR
MLVRYLHDEAGAIAFMQDRGILHRDRRCECGSAMALGRQDPEPLSVAMRHEDLQERGGRAQWNVVGRYPPSNQDSTALHSCLQLPEDEIPNGAEGSDLARTRSRGSCVPLLKIGHFSNRSHMNGAHSRSTSALTEAIASTDQGHRSTSALTKAVSSSSQRQHPVLSVILLRSRCRRYD